MGLLGPDGAALPLRLADGIQTGACQRTLFRCNPAAFHRADAAGYVLWADKVLELDAINPQLAARVARALDHWRRLAGPGLPAFQGRRPDDRPHRRADSADPQIGRASCRERVSLVV